MVDNMKAELKLDLACGNSKKIGFTGVDICQTDNTDIIHNLSIYPWPFEDNSVDEIHCSHYVEHIPHDIKTEEDKRDGFIQFMDEVYRILKPEGKVTIIAPYGKSTRALGDPTHTRSIVDETFYYYNKEWRELNKLDHYGIKCDFDVKYSYYVNNELVLKSKDVRDKAFKEDWNAIDDIIVELIKR